MSSKKILTPIFLVLSVLVLASLVSASASLSLNSIQSLTKSQNGILNITNTGNESLTNINLSFSGAFAVSFSSNNFALSPNESKTINVASTSNLSSLGLGTHSVTITAKDLVLTDAQGTYSYSITNDFCKYGDVNSSSIEIVHIKDVSTGTKDDWEWKPFDNVKITVKLENQLDYEEDFSVVLGIYDTQNKEFVEIDDEEYLEETVTLEEYGGDDTDEVSFEFEVPSDLEKSSDRYVVFVKVYADGKESQVCTSGTAKELYSSANEYLKINRNKHEVVLRDLSAPSTANAGDTIIISGKALNLGSSDEDEVKVTLKNTKLSISEESPSFELESGDSEGFEIPITIPSDAESGTYSFLLNTHYYYDSKKDTYKDTSDETWKVDVKVIGKQPSSTMPTKIAGISASLNSDAIAGQEMEIRAIISNLLSNKTTFTINARGYENWAKLNSISSETLSLNAGESKEITIKLTPNTDASGEHSFFIDVSANGKTESKELALTLEESSLMSRFKNSLQGNSVLWIIGLINAILIILIVVVIIRIASR